MAARIPQEILDELMSRADIVEIIGEYVPLQKKGRNYFGLCPFHNEDTPSFSVNPDKQFYKCFGCGEGGNIIGFMMKIENLGFPDAVRRLADRYGIVIPEKDLTPAQMAASQERQRLLQAHADAAAFYAAALPVSQAAAAYLKKRGVKPETAERFGLGFSSESDWQALPNHLKERGYSEEILIKAGLISKSAKTGRCFDKFHGRLIFPIRDNQGAVIAFGGRALGDEQPKYLNSMGTPIYNKSSHLYALDIAASAIAREKTVYIMEGYMDVLTAHSYGLANAVASLGTAFTDNQARLLSRLAPQAPEKLQVLLSFDGDGAGAKAALASLTKLTGYDFAEAQVLVIPEKLDPDDFLRQYGMRGWRRLLEKYRYPRLDYLLLRALERHDSESAGGKGAIVAELLPAIAGARNQTERESFIRRLARQLQISETAINADLAKSGLLPAGQAFAGAAPAPPPRPAHPADTAIKRDSGQLKARQQLLALAIADEKIFCLANAELGSDWAGSDEERQIIDIIIAKGGGYDFQPQSLFNDLPEENEGLRQFVLKLLETDIPGDDAATLAADCIETIRHHRLREKIAALDRAIDAAAAVNEDYRQLLAEKTRLTGLLHSS
ncbi:MAG: DNA primase [Clostridia bacterium]|nr:DNA primase [Clostridia bacterium]